MGAQTVVSGVRENRKTRRCCEPTGNRHTQTTLREWPRWRSAGSRRYRSRRIPNTFFSWWVDLRNDNDAVFRMTDNRVSNGAARLDLPPALASAAVRNLGNARDRFCDLVRPKPVQKYALGPIKFQNGLSPAFHERNTSYYRRLIARVYRLRRPIITLFASGRDADVVKLKRLFILDSCSLTIISTLRLLLLLNEF